MIDSQQNALAIAIKTRELLITPSSWSQHGFAFDENHNIVDPRSSAAQCWCLAGAIRAAEGAAWRPGSVVFAMLHNELQNNLGNKYH